MTFWNSSLVRRLVLCAPLSLSVPLAGAQTAEAPTLEQQLAPEIARFVQADRLAPPAACQVLFVGSSSIVKWRDTLATDMAPMPVINRGFGGSHIEYVNRWFDQIVVPYRPRAIVFYAGENDIDAGKSVDRVVLDFGEFMRRKTQALGKTPVYFISLKPSKVRFREFPLQSQVNARIRAQTDQRADLYYIDVVSPMLEDGRPTIFIDRRLDECRYPANFIGHVGLQFGIVHKQQIRQIADCPPAPNVRPPRPERIAILSEPG